MGTAFSGVGFRPCGGVYACVSFNRRERLRLILGGRGSAPFRYQPPPGYRGVGEAVLEAADELDALVAKEAPLDANLAMTERDSRKFICDFSDGEHGHELMAWAHRYYGSDASVHLGPGRSKSPSGMSKTSSSTQLPDVTTPITCISRRIELALAEKKASNESFDHLDIASQVKAGYEEVQKKLAFQLFSESIIISVLLARKLVMHIMVTMGQRFDLKSFLKKGEDELAVSRLFWRVVEACASLRSAGWVGEAGAMAIAAEALGLGISSNEHSIARSSAERAGVTSAIDLDDGVYLPCGGITQLLTSILAKKGSSEAVDTGTLAAAAAEAAIGSDSGGGLMAFLRESLQGAACRSSTFRSILVAAIRRSVRILAAVEYENDTESGDMSEVSTIGSLPTEVN